MYKKKNCDDKLISEYIRKHGVNKVPTGKARCATINGSICAGIYSKRPAAQAMGFAKEEACTSHKQSPKKLNTSKSKSAVKEANKFQKKFKWKNKKATEKQIEIGKKFSLKIDKKTSRMDAYALINTYFKENGFKINKLKTTKKTGASRKTREKKKRMDQRIKKAHKTFVPF